MFATLHLISNFPTASLAWSFHQPKAKKTEIFFATTVTVTHFQAKPKALNYCHSCSEMLFCTGAEESNPF